MRISALTIFFLLITSVNLSAQSGRAAAANAEAQAETSPADVKERFAEAASYLRDKAAELEAKKVPFTDRRLAQLKIEQKQLAAKFAAAAVQNKNLSGEDLYYVGMLHWIAENLDGSREWLSRFVDSQPSSAEKIQAARAIIVVSLARRGDVAEAEKSLSQYLAAEPKRITERARMSFELARAYRDKKNFGAMAGHADAAYSFAKQLLADAASRARGLDEILDAGLMLSEAQRETGKEDAAASTLDDMANEAIAAQSSSFYYYATDAKIRHLIDTGRKSDATAAYKSAIARAEKSLLLPNQRSDAVRRLKSREKHYALLGTRAPLIRPASEWFPGTATTLDALKGKVVLLDFWATWCTPCLDAFPSLREWHAEFRPQGFEILGITRFYGEVAGVKADRAAELAHLRRFRAMYKLPYDFVVMDNQSTQMDYNAVSLPTAVLIDRKGVVRFVEVGTSSARLKDLREAIERLLAEK